MVTLIALACTECTYIARGRASENMEEMLRCFSMEHYTYHRVPAIFHSRRSRSFSNIAFVRPKAMHYVCTFHKLANDCCDRRAKQSDLDLRVMLDWEDRTELQQNGLTQSRGTKDIVTWINTVSNQHYQFDR